MQSAGSGSRFWVKEDGDPLRSSSVFSSALLSSPQLLRHLLSSSVISSALLSSPQLFCHLLSSSVISSALLSSPQLFRRLLSSRNLIQKNGRTFRVMYR
ncbi:hypothetical protein EYF80_061609 [Liparis tanakae]|uniref:Uncharacterized protein n=1 Tax=Liparis tanakae TaxID=230148 RepID=A0A4Z2EHZ2_9TELE|nr:hypothetical protein EYF80_061609 [Liparis tanakae]